MYIPNPYFKNIPQIGNLVLDYIFVEDGYPVLFTCVAEERIFLCLCRTLTPIQKWILSEIKLQDLEKLIKNEICIKDAFKAYIEGKACIVKWDKEVASEAYEVIPTAYLGDEELPTQDDFLDDEDAIVYLEQVKNRIQNSIEKSIQVETESKGYFITDVVPFVGVSVSKKDNFGLFYKTRQFEFNTAASATFSVNDEKVDKTRKNDETVQAASDNIAPAA